MGEKALGRRRIGRRLLGRVPRVVPYNHHAVDADRDGIIQEGTIWERPAGMSFNVPHGSRRRPLGAEPVSRATRPPKPEVARSRRPVVARSRRPQAGDLGRRFIDPETRKVVWAEEPVHVPSEFIDKSPFRWAKVPWLRNQPPEPNLGDDEANEVARVAMTNRDGGVTGTIRDLMDADMENAGGAGARLLGLEAVADRLARPWASDSDLSEVRDELEDPISDAQVLLAQEYLYQRTQEFLADLPDEVVVYRFGNERGYGVVSFTLNPRYDYDGKLPWASALAEHQGEEFVRYKVKKSDIKFAMDIRNGPVGGEDELLIDFADVEVFPEEEVAGFTVAQSRVLPVSPDRKAERRRLVASLEAEIEKENVDLRLAADEYEGVKSGVIEAIFRKYAKDSDRHRQFGPSKMRRAVREEVDRLLETFDGTVLYGPPGTSETYAPSRWFEILDAEEIEAELSDFVEEYNAPHLFPLLTQYDVIWQHGAVSTSSRMALLTEHMKRGELAKRGAKRLTDLEASLVLAHEASDEEVVALLEGQRRKDVFRVADQIVEPLGSSPLDGNAHVEEKREEWMPLSEFKKVLRSRGYWPDPGYDFNISDRDRAGDEDLQAIYMDLFEAIRLKLTHLSSPQLSHTMRRLGRIAEKVNPDLRVPRFGSEQRETDPPDERTALPYLQNTSSINLFEDFKLLGAIQEEMEFRGLPIHVSPPDTLPVGHEVYGRRLWSEESVSRVAVSDRRDSESQTLLGVARQALEQRRFENNLYILGRGIIGDIKDADDPRKQHIYDGLGVSGRLISFVDEVGDRGSIKEESAKSVVNLMSDEQVDRIFEQLQRASFFSPSGGMAHRGSDILVGVYGKRAQGRAEELHRQRIDALEDGEQLDLGQGDKRNLVIGFIEGLHDSWAESAGDHHTRPLAVQLAAARMAGLSDEETAKRVFYFVNADDHAKARLTADRVLAAIRAIDPDERESFVDARWTHRGFPRNISIGHMLDDSFPMIEALASAVGGIDANSQERSRAASLEALIRTVAKQLPEEDAAVLRTIADYLDNPDPLMNTSDDAKFRKKREVFSMVSAMLNDGLFGDAHDEALPMMTEIAQKVVKEAAQGKGTVRLYRGVAFHNTDPYADVSGPFTMDINASPLSSWSLDRDTAEQFARRGLGEGASYVIVTDVPIEDIVGISVAGFGCIGEAECIVLGKDRQVEIVRATQWQRDSDG